MKCKTLFLTSNQDDFSQWIIIPVSIACVEINRPYKFRIALLFKVLQDSVR